MWRIVLGVFALVLVGVVVALALSATVPVWDRLAGAGDIIGGLAAAAAAVAAWRAAADSNQVARESRQALEEARLGLVLRSVSDIFFQVDRWSDDTSRQRTDCPWMVRLFGPWDGHVQDVTIEWYRRDQDTFHTRRDDWRMGPGSAIEVEIAGPNVPIEEVHQWSSGGTVTWRDPTLGTRWRQTFSIEPGQTLLGGVNVQTVRNIVDMPLN